MSDMFLGDYAKQCEIPAGEVLEKIRSNLTSFGHRGPLSLRAYGDLTGHDFPAGDIKLNHFPAGHRYAGQKKMLEDLVSWSAEHPEPCTLMLILGDTSHEFVEIVGRLKSTKNYQVLLIQPGDDDPIDQSGSVDNNNMRNRKKRRRCTCTCRGRSFSLGVAYKLKMKCRRCRIKKSKSPKVEKQSGRCRERSSVAKPNGDECSGNLQFPLFHRSARTALLGIPIDRSPLKESLIRPSLHQRSDQKRHFRPFPSFTIIQSDNRAPSNSR
ncbi:PREDICTED: uncharacterized protein LOC104753187 [Camelina sativa]|uniref:Uncharacterized protein LOC104753187 n=1 Tax=Camelina sativa TaxID=90675 RepID=A0ABM1R2F2_CAMSA|nr:PREDICTED: uncharacterized protein LOC104753187 [Camelina sativa]